MIRYVNRILILFIIFLFNHASAQKNYKIIEGDTNYMYINKQGFWNLKKRLPDGNYSAYKLKDKYFLNKDNNHNRINKKKHSIYIVGVYVDSVKHGEFRTYSSYFSKKEYHIRFVENYYKGNLHGKYSEWYNNNHKEKEGDYFNGLKNGWWNYWDEFSKPTFQILYTNDTINEIISFNKNTTINYQIKGVNGIVVDTVVFWNKDGIKEYEGYYKLGLLQFWKKWNKEGKLIIESQGNFSEEELLLDNIYNCLSCPHFFQTPRNGKLIFWNDGIITNEKHYENGIEIDSTSPRQ